MPAHKAGVAFLVRINMLQTLEGTFMPSVLIIGASRGLGLEFAKQYVADGWNVTATARKDKALKALTELGAKAILFDAVSSPAAAIARAAAKADVVIINAGVYGKSAGIATATTLKNFNDVMHANVYASMRLIPLVAPKLAANKGKLVVISSIMGSIGSMQSSNAVVYRASKAAANAVLKAAANEWGSQGLTALTFHPGWVQTDMGGKNADITPTESITGMRKVIAKANVKDNGTFFDYSGKKLPW
jgi:NAD(P)-dependent dehydrogenase (short-subunit alcohol dehydrogenase family)